MGAFQERALVIDSFIIIFGAKKMLGENVGSWLVRMRVALLFLVSLTASVQAADCQRDCVTSRVFGDSTYAIGWDKLGQLGTVTPIGPAVDESTLAAINKHIAVWSDPSSEFDVDSVRIISSSSQSGVNEGLEGSSIDLGHGPSAMSGASGSGYTYVTETEKYETNDEVVIVILTKVYNNGKLVKVFTTELVY